MPLTGKYLPGNSLIHRLNVQCKIIVFLLLIITVILTDSIIGYILLLSVLVIITAISHIRLKLILSSVNYVWRFLIIVCILNILFFHGQQVLFQWHFICVTKEGITQGINISFNIIIILILSSIFTLTTAPMEIKNGLEALLKPLSYFGIPIDQAVLILTVALQFIPTLLEECEAIRKAQTARGAEFESKYLHKRVMALGALFIPVFIAAFKRADELSTAMEARGFRDAKHRTAKKYARMPKSGWITIMGFLILLFIEIFI